MANKSESFQVAIPTGFATDRGRRALSFPKYRCPASAGVPTAMYTRPHSKADVGLYPGNVLQVGMRSLQRGYQVGLNPIQINK